jgi:hypothetical protein
MVSKSSISSPLDADGLRRLAEAATPIEQRKQGKRLTIPTFSPAGFFGGL